MELKPRPIHFLWEMYFCEDVVTNGDDRDAMLDNAPKCKDGQYQVPKTVQ